jgi:hypothetical protein
MKHTDDENLKEPYTITNNNQLMEIKGIDFVRNKV